jgi:O-antigen ligase
MGGFNLQLSGIDLTVDSRVALQGSGSIISQAILSTFYLFGIAMLLRTDVGIRMLIRAWPMFLLPAFAIVSIIWSNWPSLTLRRACALMGTLLFGLALTATLSLRPCLRLLIRVLTLSLILSAVWVVLFPSYALHHATDAIQAVHAGKWRGIFAHKNFLGGQVASLALVLLVLYGKCAFDNLFIRLAAIALAVICLVKSDSSSGYAIAFVTITLGIAISVVALMPMSARLSSLAIVLGGVLLLGIFADDLVNLAVAMLGKDPDLTGRTQYWNYLLSLMDHHWTLGYGYFAGFIKISGTLATTIHQEGFGSTHNGYLDIVVSLGIVGLVIGLGYLLWLIVGSLKFVLWGRSELGIYRTFPVCVVAYVLQHNVTESSIMAGNTIVPLMMGIATGVLVREGLIARAQQVSVVRYVPAT